MSAVIVFPLNHKGLNVQDKEGQTGSECSNTHLQQEQFFPEPGLPLGWGFPLWGWGEGRGDGGVGEGLGWVGLGGVREVDSELG